MNILDTAFAYQQSTASAASSVGQVVALYDRILRDLRGAIRHGNREFAEVDRINQQRRAGTEMPKP